MMTSSRAVATTTSVVITVIIYFKQINAADHTTSKNCSVSKGRYSELLFVGHGTVIRGEGGGTGGHKSRHHCPKKELHRSMSRERLTFSVRTSELSGYSFPALSDFHNSATFSRLPD